MLRELESQESNLSSFGQTAFPPPAPNPLHTHTDSQAGHALASNNTPAVICDQLSLWGLPGILALFLHLRNLLP